MLAFTIKLSSRGKVVYSHERIGRGGKPFRCFKFRTMFNDADKRLLDILEACPELRMEWEEKHKLVKDPRITLIGKILRKTSLDELPQFWNVLKGDLSIVGPRPVVQEEINKHFGVKAYKILSVRPGITGLWQVSGRNDTTYKTRLTLDEAYVDSHNLLLDAKLILKTIPKMLFSRGAY
jgi:undecaprenyl-phosphate galactose phosphotransferase